MRWAGYVARMGEEKKLFKVLLGKPKEKRPLERPRRRWEEGIRMDLREIDWEAYWILLKSNFVHCTRLGCEVIKS
jgi:hypothetical protein